MELEKRIIEQRTIEAHKKNLIGFQGKLYLIARFLGDEIIKQSEELNYLDFEDFDPEKIETLDEDTTSKKIGYFYSGLRDANQLEIYVDDYYSEIRVFYKGFLCYKETAGALSTYVPHAIWEDIVDKLYERASIRIDKALERKQEEDKINMKIMEEKTISELRKKWGDII
jgi:hypothetical protein